MYRVRQKSSPLKFFAVFSATVCCFNIKFYSFYARIQLLLSARLSHRNSVCPSVRPTVRHTDKLVKNGAS